jgi:hypothetical protein
MASVRLRYEAEFEPAPSAEELGKRIRRLLPSGYGGARDGQESPSSRDEPETKTPDTENVETDYVHWRTSSGPPGRARSPRSRGGRSARSSPVGRRASASPGGWRTSCPTRRADSNKSETTEDRKDPWDRVDVWEIWSKEDRCLLVRRGLRRDARHKEDPLGLQGFWPFPRPMMANLTTSKFIPKPDYALAQDLYAEINELTARIRCSRRR